MTDARSITDRLPSTPSMAVALAAGVAGLLGSYGAVGFTPGFVVAPVERTLSRLMPGEVVTFAITYLGSVGQQLNLAFATVLVVLALSAVAALALWFGHRLDRVGVPTLWTLSGVWILATALTGRPVAALGAAAGAGLVVGASELSVSLGRFTGAPTADGNGRRRVVSALGTAAVASVVGAVSGGSRTDAANDGGDSGGGGPDGGSDGGLTFDVADQIADAEAKSFDVEGMDPTISEGFYEVDISSVNPSIDPETWTLSVTGTVETELEFTYDDLRAMDHEHRFSTLRCVGEALNGHKMDNALWTGVPVASIIEEAAPSSDCNCVMLRAEDGYFEQFPIDALLPGMLVFGMNGRLLPRGHGAPVRALVPGHWGEVNVKWLTEMEFLEREEQGYWEKRGWHGTGPVKTVAKIHGKERRDDGQIVVGGHAYAGTRGISKVEVSTDGGDSWTDAELTERLGGATGPAAEARGGDREFAADAWRLWRHAYDPPVGSHEVVARAYERDGTRQPEESTGSFPSGPSGWVSQTIDPATLR